ncbi:MAG: hypothetical protein ABI818_00260 [Acidobacteriota bacterium]
MNSVVLVPDGVGVRNFVLGRFLPQLSELGDVHVVHQIPTERLPEYRPRTRGRVDWHNFSTYRETPLSFTLRYSLSYAQMNWVGTKAMRYHLERVPAKGSWRTRSADRAARLFGRVAASPARIGRIDRWHQAAVDRMPAVDHWQKLFERIRPSVLFCSHQRPPIILPPVLAARRCGIPTASFIFSWDNMTSKGRIAAPFDHYLVWSDLMRDELLRYYPDVGPERIHVVGTPQFDSYADESLHWPREAFFSRIKADPSRKLICFSGNNVDNGPEDQDQVRILMEFIRSGRIAGNPQVVLRPAPVDDGSRFDGVRRDFPELIYAHPGWSGTQKGWDHVLPPAEDITFLTNLTRHSDLNINFGSTMSLDFAVQDKPVINAAFDVASPPVFGMPAFDFCMQFDHYRPVAELGASRFARTADQFADFVNLYLSHPETDREGRRRLADLQVSGPLGSSTRRIVSVLSQIARPSAPAAIPVRMPSRKTRTT